MVIWLVGMSGAGKTTIGTRLTERLRRDNPATVHIDGDDVRAVFDTVTDHSVEGRRANNRRIRQLCSWLDGQGIDVVCSILSIVPEATAWNRAHYTDYLEVYVRAPFDVLAERHPADLYGRALRGEVSDVVGIDIDFPIPANPDLVLDNGTPPIDLDDACDRIIAAMSATVAR